MNVLVIMIMIILVVLLLWGIIYHISTKNKSGAGFSSITAFHDMQPKDSKMQYKLL